MMDIDHNVTGFSFSGISTFQSCPRAFKYRYIDQLNEAFSSIEAHMGTCVHTSLEWAYMQKQQGFVPTVDMAVEQYRYAWKSDSQNIIKVIKKEKTAEDYFNQGKEFLESFFKRVFPFDNSTTLYLEHQFLLPLTVLGKEISYRGVIDRIAKEPDGTIRIIDYKTGRVGQPLDTLQLPSYALYIFQNNIDSEILLCYEDLREQRTLSVPFARKEARKVKEDLVKEIETILNTKIDTFIPQPSILCWWCGFNHICDAAYDPELINEPTPPGKLSVANTNNGEIWCPQCGGLLQEKKGRFGLFLGCTNFPQCRYTRDIGKKKNDSSQSSLGGVEKVTTPKEEIFVDEATCPECGGMLKKRRGKFGEFWGCANYPECRFTRPV